MYGKVLKVCLDEIERCRPFFIGILGERYGYIPDEVPGDTEFTHPWLAEYKAHSLTALEIIHGVCPWENGYIESWLPTTFS